MHSRVLIWNLAVAGMVLLMTAAVPSVAPARQGTPLTGVEFVLPSLDYDVVYLADFLEVTTGKLASSIPKFSGEMRAIPSNADPTRIYLKLHAFIQLQGDATRNPLVDATTTPFKLNQSRVISARDFAEGGVSDIKIQTSFEYKDQRDRLEDYIKRFPTAPVGTYTFVLEAYPKNSNTLIGSATKEINIRNASPDEVVVSLIDPQPGAVLSTLIPTFSWSSPNADVTLLVYEKLPIHRTPQEATTGIPHLKIDLAGVSTYTYPVTGARRLENGKTYVWLVRTKVKTNRGAVERDSELRVFRLQMGDERVQQLERFLNALGGNAAGTLSTLENMGWIPRGDITLDGKRLTKEELNRLLTDLGARNVQLQVRVE